jgi:hypothetical protein
MITEKERRMEVKEILYFDESSMSNIDPMVEFVAGKIEALGIHRVMIAWSSGYTLRKFLEATQNAGLKLDIAVVTNPKGGKIMEREVSISDEVREELEKKGIRVCYLNDDLGFGEPHALEPGQRSRREMLRPFGIPEHLDPLDIDVGTDLSLLVIISQGFRVCVGCTVLAVRHGLITEGERVLCLAGKSTALVLQAGATAKTTFVKEILGFERNSDWASRKPGDWEIMPSNT